MKWYTVVGFYEDNGERHVEWIKATSPEAAEDRDKARKKRAGTEVKVCAVFEGRLSSKENRDLI